MASFCKNEDCPPSQDLLAFLDGGISLNDGVGIRRHLSVCEFCSAELDFYERYPQADEPLEIESPKMPEPLLELAEALMPGKQGISSLERLFSERDEK
ncbi:MAG: hypothetical protein QUS14_13500 [Pyrinomonadaceae bacterium]|nr:hypothetical protein [Pyrinomonadaceae bacterium]